MPQNPAALLQNRATRIPERYVMDITSAANELSDLATAPLPTDDVTAELPPLPLLRAGGMLIGLAADLDATHKKHLAGQWTGGIRCGIGLIDTTLRGLRPASVSYLLAAPNIGKSTFVNQLAYQVSAYPGQSAAAIYVTYENPPTNLLLKHMARLSGWPQNDIDAGKIGTDDKHITTAVNALASADLWYLAAGKHVSFDDIRRAVETVKTESGAEYIFCAIDYLQYYAKASTAKENRYEQVNAAVVDMRELPNMTNAHVMVISSQNRATNKGDGGEGMHGGTGSGDIEYDADLMLTLATKDKDSKDHEHLLLTATKTRYGGKHKLNSLIFDADRASFAVVGDPE